MATIKEFLVKLESDPLLTEYRGKKTKQDRKAVATREGLSDAQAEVLQSNNVKKIRKAIEDEGGGGELFFVIMLD